MEAKTPKVSKSITASVIDLSDELEGVKDKTALANEIGELLVEEILQRVADSDSPVSGGRYKQTLSKEYRKYKIDETGSGDANLDLTGEMLSSLDYRVRGTTVEIGLFDPTNAGKADGHNNFSGRSRLPQRKFLPDEGETFKRDILALVNEKVDSYKVDTADIKKSDLKEIETKKELFDFLVEATGIFNRKKLINNVLGNKKLVNILDELDLLEFLR